ncbi:aspartate carbamoyltransferase, partial [Candidatus Woesebacteria bacterium]|nr:aspartate carbamoyltransferase [Candidatus Woesebacteria bacterium]
MSKGLYAGKDILSLAQFDRKSIDKILHSTKKIIALSNKNKCSNVLKGSIIALLFFEPSTRTYNSFSSAAQRLGAGVIGLRDISVTSMVKGETFEDT